MDKGPYMSIVPGRYINKREEAKINKMRKELGLQPLSVKVRPCIRCERRFESEGHHNRMCNKCRFLMDGKQDV